MSQTTHQWFTEQIAAYLADGLTVEETVQFRSHAEECAQCAAQLESAEHSDAELRNLFSGIEPSVGFEDRLIQSLRQSPGGRLGRPWPSLRLPNYPRLFRAAAAVAAVIAVGTAGYVATNIMAGKSEIARPVIFASNLKQIGEAQLMYSNDGGDFPRQIYQPQAAQSAAVAYALQRRIAPTGVQDLRYVDNGNGAAVATESPYSAIVVGPRQTAAPSPAATDSFLSPSEEDSNGDATVSSAVETDSKSTFTGGGQITRGSFATGISSGVIDVPAARQHRADNLYYKPADEAGKTDSGLLADASKGYREIDTGRGASAGGGGGAGETTPVAPAQWQTPADDSSQSPSVLAGRQVIRHGQMSFVVDSFDSAFLQIQKITAEEGGFISAASSDRLANGKVSGSITVRLPPQNLDILVLKLRALGDLTGEKIVSDDITKDYTDLQSELRADQAMEDRILDIIKTGKGQVKDLLAAENEAGVWREKVEQITGEINYYNNLIGLSTLEISLTERDIRQSASATETENVSMGIETNDVVTARGEALKSIDIHHGRVTDSELRQLDAGEFAATIEAAVPPDDAGPLLDNLRQIGAVARLEMNRQQTTIDNQPVIPGAQVEREDTQFQISIYNLANIQPRQTENIAMACQDVEAVYHNVIARVLAAGGRIVQSDLNRVTAQQIDGSIDFETPADQADAVLTDVRGLGEVMNLTVTENPDAANVTSAKRGFALTLASFAEIAPRQSVVVTILPGEKVADAYNAIQAAAVSAGANITTAQLQEQQSQSTSATLVFSLPVAEQPQIEKALAAAIGAIGREIDRQAATSNDLQHTLANKMQFTITLASADQLAPRQTTDQTLAVSDVASAYNAILAAAQQGDSKIAAANLDQSNPQAPVGRLDLIIPRAAQASVESAIDAAKPGVISRTITRSADLSNTTDEKSELQLVLVAVDQLPPRQTITLDVLVSDPQQASSDLQAAALSAGGRVMDQTMQLGDDHRPESHLEIQVPLKDGPQFIDRLRDSGTLQSIDQTKNDQLLDADFTQARLDITFDQENSLWSTIQSGLSTSIRGLLYSLEFVVIGVCLVLPLAAAFYAASRMVRRLRRKSASAPVSSGS
ncbi:MAG TPA: DUF4349 domain-containing protein [Tepidisphaeraceae bacterium]|nr:DUF4349 domain-containing protein [Tepidisphaeraceae bacterium]